VVPVEVGMTVTIPAFPFRDALDWAKENCPSYITNDLHQDGYNTYDHTKMDYYFSDEKDALIFALRWIK
jgi:hypothetical protein